MKNDRDIQGPESSEQNFNFQLKPGVYEYGHNGRNSFNLILILSLAAGSGTTKSNDFVEKGTTKHNGLNKMQIVSPIDPLNNMLITTQSQKPDTTFVIEKPNPIPKNLNIDVVGMEPSKGVDSLIFSTPSILFKTVDTTHPIEEGYLLQEVEPNLIRLIDLNGLLESGFNFPVLNSEIRVHSLMKDDLIDLINKAQSDGISIYVRSGYRNYWEQQYALNKVNGDTSKVSLPGQSQHQTGLAIDFSTPENEHSIGLYSGFENTKTGKWLVENSWKFGYIQSYVNGHDGIDPLAEPHHYLYVGLEIAKMYHELKDMGWKGDIIDLQQIFSLAVDSGTSEK
ncbi:hypothetical protein A2422_01145 [Candidatus Woesebacteria bacterium RIFOXYC1_FULL_31_51]|nr:MAG: hypothetical protein UR17_C0001G0679 [Candidatus Woesebacteria bacterium GW2011_GWF1_31_35]OGM82695.1 MAG: hypothetical protein A2422_01145 [Candidatus Woesebacteria bacterium RIFOXYC1_FULL_31_51]HLD89998.1 M15 family metallopeptidase [Patescibacteria group bacterium]